MSDDTVWKNKDMLNSRMSAIKAASLILEGTSWGTEDVLKQADEYYKWITQDQPWSNEPVTVTPTPTAKQKKLLEAVAKKLGKDFEEIVTGCKKFPSNEKEAKSLYGVLKGEK